MDASLIIFLFSATDIALIKNNALFGARISVELSKMEVSLGSCGKFSDSGVREFSSVSDSEVVHGKDAKPRKAEVSIILSIISLQTDCILLSYILRDILIFRLSSWEDRTWIM